jgi:unsaturated rhamnogalacturonyl hydrolase
VTGATSLPPELRDQLAVQGGEVAPFVERYLATWKPYRLHWNYEDGCIFKGCLDLAAATGQPFPRDFVHREVGSRVGPGGTIAGFDPDEFNIDNVNAGKSLFELATDTGEPRFRLAIERQYEQLLRHPRTKSGNYWHKKIYPHQVWLDGLYMAQPFQLSYAMSNATAAPVADSLRQFANVRATMRDARTGLYYHGWDESRRERWSDPQTGCSPHFWARSMGWFAMALVDACDVLSGTSHENSRAELQELLRDVTDALLAVRSDAKLWWQVLDHPGRKGNYEECSASLMIAYSLMKGSRLGLLAPEIGHAGAESLAACLARFLDSSELKGICGVAGLGGSPYRDGSYSYYVSEPVVANDPKGVGALLMALAEAHRRKQAASA